MCNLQLIQTFVPSHTKVNPDQQVDYILLNPSDVRPTKSFIWVHGQKRDLTVLRDLITAPANNPTARVDGSNFRHCWNEVCDAVRELDAIVETESLMVGGRENVVIMAVREGCAVSLMYLMETDEPLGAFCGYKLCLPFLSDILFIGQFGEHPQHSIESFLMQDSIQGPEAQESDTPMTAEDLDTPMIVGELDTPMTVEELDTPTTAEEPNIFTTVEESDIPVTVEGLDTPTANTSVTVEESDTPITVEGLNMPIATKDPNTSVTVEESNTPMTVEGPDTPTAKPYTSTTAPSASNNLFDSVSDEVPDQSPQAKLDRIASFLRRLHWKPECIPNDTNEQDVHECLKDLGFVVRINGRVVSDQEYWVALRNSASFLYRGGPQQTRAMG
ncbi:hypothetical protein FPOAC1_000539 [Fusarium poae]|uniref:hypothetical protein n=1 Tax=Fusarium poae TaxID=36050 RepID=UPI001CEB887F|nr:hypothetical protein FPOAC1_000539 [Fusarium poae]KAG8674569.1 hypothetical protein FPOAC1_000539 [Fusarium poae]